MNGTFRLEDRGMINNWIDGIWLLAFGCWHLAVGFSLIANCQLPIAFSSNRNASRQRLRIRLRFTADLSSFVEASVPA